MKNGITAPAPLFRDPVYDGPTDPVVMYNHLENSWWIIYTQRRATDPACGVAWVHGTALGVASSFDQGKTWFYRGTLNMEAVEPGHNTFWAPEVFFADGIFHMFVSYITGIRTDWNAPRHILHYTSQDLWNWKYAGTLNELGGKAIDACVYPLPQGGWRLFYKNEAAGSHTQFADSEDFEHWSWKGDATSDCAQEGPNVFSLNGDIFMIADRWDGLAVYHTDDLLHWERQPGNFMSEAGTRTMDTCRCHHADVVSFGSRAYIFYFVHPNANDAGEPDESARKRMSVLQTAELINDHGTLKVIRDEPFDFDLSGKQVW